jgi:5,10-methylenetetrahydromethanopterin reductase
MAEELGYEAIWIPDQSFHRDPFILLAECAAATSEVRLGVAVTNPYTRHPVQIARAAATLAELSGGRFILGLGAGNRSRVLPALGLPGERTVQRLDACIDACRRLLSGERVTIRSRDLVLDSVQLDQVPPASVPIYVGGRGPGVLRLAGARADGVFMEALFTAEGLRYGIGEVEAGARSVGRQLRDIDLVAWQALHLTTVTSAPDMPSLRNWAGRILIATSRNVLTRTGIPPSVAEAAREDLAERGDEAMGRRVPDEVVERLLMVGDADVIESRLRVLLAAGVDRASFISFGITEAIHAHLQAFAREVMPRFSASASGDAHGRNVRIEGGEP